MAASLFLVAAALLMVSSSAKAQSKSDFQSHQSGNWSSTSTWEDRQGNHWSTPAASAPTSSDGVLTIRAGHTVTVTSGVTVDGVVIQAGGQLTVNSGVTLTIANGAGTDLDVFGTLQNAGTIALASGATIVVEPGATYQHSQNGGTIPAMAWNSSTTCEITGVTSSAPAGLNQSFYHFIWNCASQTADVALGGNPGNVSGDFTVANTGGHELVGASGANGWILAVGGDLNLSGGNFNFSSGTSGTLALNLAGSYHQTAGSFDCSNSGSTLGLNFTGPGSSFSQSGGALLTSRINFGVANSASLTLNNGLIVAASRTCTVSGTLNCGLNVISGAGAFTLAGGGTLTLGDPGGISASGTSGNIQVGGPRTFATTASYVYNGTAAQLSGDGLPASIDSLAISNGAGVALSVTTTVNRLLGLTAGVLHTGANQLNLATGATVSGASSSSYVDGTLLKAFGAGTGQSFTFPVGDSSTYAPVNIAALNVGSAGTLAASTITGDHPGLAVGGLDSSRSVNRYWTLAAGGGLATSSCNATFNYAASDVDIGASTAAFLVRRYGGGAWATTTIGTRTATSAQVTGLNAFGDFAVGQNLIDHYTVAAATPQAAGVAFTTTVTAQDILNQIVAWDSTTPVTLGGTGAAQFDSNGDSTFGDNTKTLSNGTFTISTKDNIAEAVTLVATDASSRTGSSGTVLITAAAASKLILATQPSANATAGQPFVQQPVLLIADAFNNVRSSDTLTVTATRSGGAGILLGTTSMAAVNGVVTYTNLAHAVATNISIRFTSGALTATTSGPVAVSPGAFSRLLALLPGESSAPGTATGRAGTPSAIAGADTTVRVLATDDYFNPVNTAADTVGITTTDPNAVLPANVALVNGATALSVVFRTSGNHTVTATDFTDGSKIASSDTVTVEAGPLVKLQLLLPGETAAPGTATGKTGVPLPQNTDNPLSVAVNAVDANWNRVSTNDTIAITCSDANAALPANAALVNGTRTLSLTSRTVGAWTVTASDITHAGVAASTSPSISVSAGAFAKLQLLLPGETGAAGTTTGKTGTPSSQTAGTSFNVTVNAVDANWNPLATVTDTVRITASDANAVLPANASLLAGAATFSVVFKTGGSATVTATDVTDGTKTANTSSSTLVNAGTVTRLQLLMPGETAAPGTSMGKTGTPAAQTAGTPFSVTVNAVDPYWNVGSSTHTIAIASSDANAGLPANAALVGGTRTFSVTFKTAGSWTVTATDTAGTGTLSANTSASATVNAGAFTKLQVLVPGEDAAPGSTTGKTGTPGTQDTDHPFTVVVNGVDANWNLVNTVTDTVGITSSDANAVLPANAALSGGTRTFSVKCNTAGSRTVTAADITNGGKTANTGSSITVSPGVFAKLQVLMPGEAAAPGTTSGKTGTPTAQTAGTSFSVTVKAVDASWNGISTNDTVQLTSSDSQATLPVNTALNNGSVSLSLTNRTSGIQTVTASDLTHAGVSPSTGTATTIGPAVASKLVFAVQPSPTAIAGIPFVLQPVLLIEDQYNNVRSNDTLVVTATRSAGAGSLLGTTNVAAVGGVAAFTNLAHPLATSITIAFTSGSLAATTSGTITVSVGSFAKLQLLAPGEAAAPGTTSGKTGAPTAQTAGTAFNVTVNAVDANWNRLNTATDTVGITSSDANAVLPSNAALNGGTRIVSLTLKTAGSQTVTAADLSDGTKTPATSSPVTVNAGGFAKLQLLVPGETAAPGTMTGKTGTPLEQDSSTAFTVTANGVDADWNLVNTNDAIRLTSSDPSAILPANAALVAGTRNLTLTLKTAGSSTLTASDITHAGISPNTSPPITVRNALAARWGVPVVAIHDSELTRALESMPAGGATLSGSGTTGFEWWPTTWHYFVMPEAIQEALRSDGTVFKVVGDADISAGGLLDANGRPKYPILISLAAEAIRDDEIAQLTNYVAAGGFLFVGSSSFTRNTNGTTRHDFALADEMGIHMVQAGLTNWGANNTFTKITDHRLISDIPSGTLTWRMPSASEEIPWGISPDHPPFAAHPAWQVQSSNATILAQGDNYPYLLTKPFGKGQFIYHAGMQPLVGFSGFAPNMHAYLIFRKAIEWAFESAKLPVLKVSPWPYSYDAAFMARRDLENFTNAIAAIAASAQIDHDHGAKGDYYFCTGTLREDAAPSYNTNTIIAGLRSAVSSYGATICPHNGGLKNPNNPALVRGQYDYWHWGPDEALDVTPANYSSGKAYALASISKSFQDVEGWMSGLTNGLRAWVGCYFNATREDSYDIQAQLGVNIAGEQKLGPFPHWTLSTRTPGKRYAFLSEPVSDWFVGGMVAQSLEPWHPPGVQTSQTLHDAVDFYYNLGGLINFYSHTLSTGLGGAGDLQLDYITYSLNTNLHPRLWSANAASVYQWWLQRSNVQMNVSNTADGNQSVTTLSIAGASNTDTAVEILLPDSGSAYGLKVLTNGVLAGGNSYRTNGNLIKVQVGTSIATVQVRYSLSPGAQDDSYSATAGTALNVAPPGVLVNDTPWIAANLTAALVSGPGNGTLNLNADGSFSYTPAAGFVGIDRFTYQANDGVTNSSTATVTVSVLPVGTLFADDFTRPTDPGTLAPWEAQSGNWTTTGGVLEGGPSALNSLGFAYLATDWTNYSVQARIQFPTGAGSGGLAGRVNPVTGARYAAWLYPEDSPGGPSVLRLIKFQNRTSFGYNGSDLVPMQEVILPAVGTDWHTLKLSMVGNQIAVYYDGSRVMNVTDVEAAPYASGGISIDTWTGATAYIMSVDDLSVVSAPTPRIGSISYSRAALTIIWSAVPGQRYRVQYKDKLSDPIWNDVLPEVTATDETAAASLPVEGVARRFYRLLVVSAIPAPAPHIESIAGPKAVVTITWSAVPGQRYRVQYNDNLSDSNWNDVLPEITATDVTAATSLSVEGVARRYYRLMLVP